MTQKGIELKGRVRTETVIGDGTYLGEASEKNRYHLRERVAGPKPLTLSTKKGQPTFAKLPMVLVMDRELQASAKIVWAYLHFRQGENETAWPSQETIAQHTFLSRTTISRSIIQLEKLGWLKVFRTSAGTQRWNSYMTLFPNYANEIINSCNKKGLIRATNKPTNYANLDDALSQIESVKEPLIKPLKETIKDQHQSRLVERVHWTNALVGGQI